MKLIFLILFLIGVALGRPQQKDSGNNVKLLSYNNEPLIDKSYKFSYELSDKQNRNENGEIKYVGDEPILVVRGSYSFVADNGVEYTVNYIADENGFRPTGAHIPGVEGPPPDLVTYALPAGALKSLLG